jgi:tRNA U34 2-thiouridine synthase MnmA/TrmU
MTDADDTHGTRDTNEAPAAPAGSPASTAAGERVRAVGMISGGLDSTLAVKIMQDLGIDVIAVNISTMFCSCSSIVFPQKVSRIKTVSSEFKVPLIVQRVERDYVEMVKQPRFGYGKGLNPCQDCRIHMFRMGKQVMEEHGARFLFTGEVLGQRPMSQQSAQLRRIEVESGLEGLILRPLSARHLPATTPEKMGWVDRRKLLAISGRSRKPQMELAAQLSITDYPCAGGGCLLTEPGFAAKVQDLFVHDQDGDDQLRLLRFGRHFRIDERTKLVLGRNETENRLLKNYAGGAGCVAYRPGAQLSGPDGLLASGHDPVPRDIHRIAASLLLRYSGADRQAEHPVAYGRSFAALDEVIVARACTDDEVRRYRVAEKLTKHGYARRPVPESGAPAV